MSFYSGSSGYLIYEGMKAAKVQNWQFSNSLSTLDATTLGDRDPTLLLESVHLLADAVCSITTTSQALRRRMTPVR